MKKAAAPGGLRPDLSYTLAIRSHGAFRKKKNRCIGIDVQVLNTIFSFPGSCAVYDCFIYSHITESIASLTTASVSCQREMG